jgi:hypothetical protein
MTSGAMDGAPGAMRGARRSVMRGPRVCAVMTRRCIGRLNERSRRDHGSRCKKLFDHCIVPQISMAAPGTRQVDC